MQATIMKVFPEGRSWGNQYPDMMSVRVVFDSGDFGEYGTKKDFFEKHRAALEDLIGKPSEFGDVKSKEYNGITTHTFKEYPGKPTGQGGAGGGGRQFVPAYHQTKEGHDAEQERMDRRTALMQSVLRCGTAADDVTLLATADMMYKWLRKTAGSTGSTANPRPAPATQAPAQARQTVTTVQQELQDDPEGDPASGHVPSRPQGSTADSVEVAALRAGMAWLKGWMKHWEMDPNEVELRRFMVGAALGEDIESCKDLNSGQWAEVKSVLGKMDSGEVTGLREAFRNSEEMRQFAAAGG